VGHVSSLTDPSRRILSDDELVALVRSAAAERLEVCLRPSLALDHLHEEILADEACVRWLWSSVEAVMLSVGGDVDPMRFVLALAATFVGYSILNLCRQVADDCTSTDPATQLIVAADLFALRIGFQVRAQIALDWAIQLCMPDLVDENVHPALRIALLGVRRRSDQMFTGFQWALDEVYRYAPPFSRPVLFRAVPGQGLGQPHLGPRATLLQRALRGFGARRRAR
jgi:hypothetical protein